MHHSIGELPSTWKESCRIFRTLPLNSKQCEFISCNAILLVLALDLKLHSEGDDFESNVSYILPILLKLILSHSYRIKS